MDIAGYLNGANCLYPTRRNLLGFPSHLGATMTVKIDGVEPNIFLMWKTSMHGMRVGMLRCS